MSSEALKDNYHGLQSGSVGLWDGILLSDTQSRSITCHHVFMLNKRGIVSTLARVL